MPRGPNVMSGNSGSGAQRLPFPVYVLGFAIFAQGTSELMVAGLLPSVSRELHVPIAHAGLLISAFAVGMLIGAPVLAVLSRSWPHRRALLAFLAVFTVAHIAGALAPNYTILLASRVIGAFVYAGFWAVASATAIDLVPLDSRGRAMGIVAGGLTLATVVGLPGGTLVGDWLGWRAAFWSVAVLTVLATVAVTATIRPNPQTLRNSKAVAGAGGLRCEVRSLLVGRLWRLYAVTALATGALLVSFSYISPLLTHVTRLAPGAVPAVLVLYGVGAIIGITLGGRTADRHPIATLYTGIVALALVSILLALLARWTVPAVILAAALGFTGFVTNPTLNSRPMNLVQTAPTLVAALNVCAFNTGITLGPWLGGLALDHRAGYPIVAWVGAGLATAAVLALLSTSRASRPIRSAPARWVTTAPRESTGR